MSGAANFHGHFQCRLVGAAVQLAKQGANGGGDTGLDGCQCAGANPPGERAAVKAVLHLQNLGRVQHAYLLLCRGATMEHVEEVLVDQPAGNRGKNRLALAQTVVGGDQGRNLGGQEQALFRVLVNFQYFFLRQGKQGYQPLQHQHGMQIPGYMLQQINFGVSQACVQAHKRFQPAFFLFRGPVPEQDHPHHVQVWHANQVVDVDATVTQQPLFALHVRNSGLANNNASQVG